MIRLMFLPNREQIRIISFPRAGKISRKEQSQAQLARTNFTKWNSLTR